MIPIEITCPECGKICVEIGGLKLHIARTHGEKKYIEIFGERKVHERYNPKLDEKTIDECNKLSNLNYLKYVKGDISQMNMRNKRILMEEGILKLDGKIVKVGRPGIFSYTKYGNEILHEL